MLVNRAALQGLFVTYNTNFNKAFTETKTVYQQFATVVPSTTSSNTYAWLGQLPNMREWIGEREIQKLEAHSYTILNKQFEGTVAVPKPDIEDDNFGVYAPIFSALGENAAKHPDDLTCTMLMEGFENLCYDGQPFFSKNHRVGSMTYSNMTDAPLSAESYLAARTAIMSVRGENGKSLNLIPDLLVVSPHNERAARLILEADQINGTTNVLKGTAKLLVDPHFAEEPEAWYLLASSGIIKPLIYQDRKKPKLVAKTNDTDENVFNQNLYMYGVESRGNAGYSFWQMAYGSTGTGGITPALAWIPAAEPTAEPAAEPTAEPTGEPEAKTAKTTKTSK